MNLVRNDDRVICADCQELYADDRVPDSEDEIIMGTSDEPCYICNDEYAKLAHE